jgi:hypothetical protein
MGAASPGEAHLAGSLVCKLLWCCQHHPPGSVTKLLVSCVLVSFTQFDLILTWPCCETAMCSIDLYPSGLKEQMLHLAIYSMMQWQSICPSLRVLILTLYLFLFHVSFAGYNIKMKIMKTIVVSLVLGFFLLLISDVIFFSVYKKM